jgi:hypothetical protein
MAGSATTLASAEPRAGTVPGAAPAQGGPVARNRREVQRPVGAGPAPRGRAQRAAPGGGFASADPEAVENVRPISMLPVAEHDGTAPAAAPTRVAAAADRRARESAVSGRGAAAAQEPTSWRTSPPPASDSTQAVGRRAGSGQDADAPLVPGRARELSVVKTVWHPDAARRIAEVSVAGEARPREVREGDRVEGLAVREIKLSGVVFERDGVQVERRVSGRR